VAIPLLRYVASMPGHLHDDRGFSLIELIGVIAVSAILVAIAVPQMSDAIVSMRLGQGTREVERELQTARLKAVSSNRSLRVRTNCPTAGFYRMVEYLGTIQTPAAEDTAANRCLNSAYPFPAADTNPITRPNHDGPVRIMLPDVTVTTAGIEFRPDGTAWLVGGDGRAATIPLAGTDLTLTHRSRTRRINVNPLGKITIQ
jgi:prepilin-type N-terminal cleavage/methylation domain-containing protein